MIDSKHMISRDESTYLTPEYVRFLYEHDLVIDASAGGLIQGPSRADGGIMLVGWNRQADVFVVGEVEGWVYLLNPFAHNDQLAEVERRFPNASLLFALESLFRPYAIPEGTTVLNVEPKEVNGKMVTPVLMFDTSNITVLSKSSVLPHLSFLEEINRIAWERETSKPIQYTMSQTAMLAKWGPLQGVN